LGERMNGFYDTGVCDKVSDSTYERRWNMRSRSINVCKEIVLVVVYVWDMSSRSKGGYHHMYRPSLQVKVKFYAVIIRHKVKSFGENLTMITVSVRWFSPLFLDSAMPSQARGDYRPPMRRLYHGL